MSDLILPDHLKTDKKSKRELELEGQLLIASQVLTRSKHVIEDLKLMFEDNLKIMGDLEIANCELRSQLSGNK